MSTLRTIVLALDGFDVSMLSLDEFSYLRSLYREGASSQLLSTIPYVTPSAFATIETGKDIGKHGVSGFLKFDGFTKSRLYTGRDIEDRTFYEILHGHGKKCFIMLMPYSYPPKIEGDIVFDWLSGKSEKSILHPPSLAEDFPGLAELRAFPDKVVNLAEFIRGIRVETRKSLDVIAKIFRSRKYDFSFFYVPAPDRIMHTIGIDIAEGNQSKSVDIAKETFQDIDNCIKTINSELRSEESLMIMSDHGFTIYDYQFFINDWLEDNGYLVYGGSDASTDTRSARLAKKFLPDIDNAGQVKTVRIPKAIGRLIRKNRALNKLAIPLRKNIERSLKWSIVDAPNVNLDKSAAVCFEFHEQGIYLNRRVLSPAETEATKKEIIMKLSSTGVDAYDKNQLYAGPNADNIADIYLASSKYSFGLGLGGNGFEDVKNGDHRREGILILSGESFEKKTANGVLPSLLDIAPTILHMMDTPVPADMQGRVLNEWFGGSSELASRKTRYVESTSMSTSQTGVMSAEEEEVVKERLRSLGYI